MPPFSTAEPRRLPFPLNEQAAMGAIVPDSPEPCGLPAFPEDSDEQITVLFRLSLTQFVALASAVDVGSDIAFGDDGPKLWWLWITSIMCASFCEEMATCFTDQNEALMSAVAEAISQNQQLRDAVAEAISENGGATPGKPISDRQATQDTLPPGIKGPGDECDLNALWGACLFLVQQGNRTIEDFFQELERASNQLETMAITANLVPAAGSYAEFAAEFADQLQENLSEGYTAAYTETYENDLACDLFCYARENCELSMDDIIEVLNLRLPDPEDVTNFGLVMARAGTGTFSGPEICDIMFYIYFTAMRFGQQFMDQIGIRSLTANMSLGADYLATDNWQVLCDCPVDWSHRVSDADVPEFVSFPPLGFPTESVGEITGDVISATSSSGDFVTGTNIRIDLGAEHSVTRVLVHQIAGAGAPDGGFVNGFINLLDAGFSVVASATLPQDNGEWQEAVVYAGDDVRYIDVQRVFLGGALTQEWNIDIEGTGTDPFI